MTQRDTVADLIDHHGRTYAAQAGITLRDKPSPLFCLLVLTMLSSTRISADIAATSTREVLRLGRTPERLRATTWQQRVDALGRGGYRRYDESTATKLEELADHVIAEHHSDLRRIRPSDHGGVARMREAIADVPRIGPTGSEIFAREVQGVWPEVAPYFDTRSLRAARSRGLPDDPGRLARLAPQDRVAELAAALVRAGPAT